MASRNYTGKNVSLDMTLTERLNFYSVPEPNTGCTLWFGGLKGRSRRDAQTKTEERYGVLSFHGLTKPAHVWAWESVNGPLPAGLIVMHKCDFPPCINPDHLKAGTQRENITDRDRKGRQRSPKGEASPFAKLTGSQVLAIRADPRSKRVVAKEYGVTFTAVQFIRQGRTWKHI